MGNFVTLKLKKDGATEVAASVFGLSITETINELSTCSFSIFSDKKNALAIEALQPFTRVYVASIGQWFTITNINSTSNTDTRLYAVTAIQVGTELHHKFVSDKLMGSQSLNACLDKIIEGTPFKYEVHDSFNNYSFSDGFGGDHADTLLLSTLKGDFDFEIYFDNFTFHIYKSIGYKDMFAFVDGHNVTKINATEDYTGITTYIKGTGKPNEGDNAGYIAETDYTSPNIDTWGKIEAQPISDERFTDNNSLREYLKSKLQDYPIVQYTVESATLESEEKSGVAGRASIGNWGLLKDRLGIDVDVRIIGKTTYPSDPTQKDTVTFGNKLFDFSYLFSKQSHALQNINAKMSSTDISELSNSVKEIQDEQIIAVKE